MFYLCPHCDDEVSSKQIFYTSNWTTYNERPVRITISANAWRNANAKMSHINSSTTSHVTAFVYIMPKVDSWEGLRVTLYVSTLLSHDFVQCLQKHNRVRSVYFWMCFSQVPFWAMCLHLFSLLFSFKGIVRHFGKRSYLLPCTETDEKIDATVCPVNMKPAHGYISSAPKLEIMWFVSFLKRC